MARPVKVLSGGVKLIIELAMWEPTNSAMNSSRQAACAGLTWHARIFWACSSRRARLLRPSGMIGCTFFQLRRLASANAVIPNPVRSIKI